MGTMDILEKKTKTEETGSSGSSEKLQPPRTSWARRGGFVFDSHW